MQRTVTRSDAAIATTLMLVLGAAALLLVRGEDEVLRWYAVPTGSGAITLLVVLARAARAQCRARWSSRVDAVAEQMAEVATWCGRLSAHFDEPMSTGLSKATKVRVARAVTQGEAALATWSAGPVRLRAMARLERATGRLLPEMAAAHQRAEHERTIASCGRAT